MLDIYLFMILFMHRSYYIKVIGTLIVQAQKPLPKYRLSNPILFSKQLVRSAYRTFFYKNRAKACTRLYYKLNGCT